MLEHLLPDCPQVSHADASQHKDDYLAVLSWECRALAYTETPQPALEQPAARMPTVSYLSNDPWNDKCHTINNTSCMS